MARFHGCVNQQTQALRVIDPAQPGTAGHCTTSGPHAETSITWSQRGPAGPAGPAGGDANVWRSYISSQHVDFTTVGVGATLDSVAVPAGTYSITAQTEVGPDNPATGSDVGCALATGGLTDTAPTGFILESAEELSLPPGTVESSVSMIAVATFTAPSQIFIWCDLRSGDPFFGTTANLVALAVGQVNAPVS